MGTENSPPSSKVRPGPRLPTHQGSKSSPRGGGKGWKKWHFTRTARSPWQESRARAWGEGSLERSKRGEKGEAATQKGRPKARFPSCRTRAPKTADVSQMSRRAQRAPEKEREVAASSARLCLSRGPAPRPSSLPGSRWGAPDPSAAHPWGAERPAGPGHSRDPTSRLLGRAGQPRARAYPGPANTRATSCHCPSTPCPCSAGRPGSARRGDAGSETAPLPPAFRPSPDIPRAAGRPPRPPARQVATSQLRLRARPGPSERHSQWRRGCSGKTGAVRAAGAQAGPEPGALQSERTTRR